LGEIVADIIEALKPIFETALEYTEGKTYKIISAKYREPIDRIEIEFMPLENPVQAGVIILAILAVLGVFGAFLTFDKIEEIVEESPVVAGGIFLLPLILLILFFYFGKKSL
jgi:hypothetical protein